MRLLLDANAFLFFIAGDPRLSTAARLAIDDPHSEKLISIATLWEIAIKASIGKLALAKPFEVLMPTQIAKNGFAVLPITIDHLCTLGGLPLHHRDPFDRLIVAQAVADSMHIVSSDAALDAYPVHRIW